MYYRQISFVMGWNYGLKAFTATILGGIGNIPAAMLGGLLLGLVEMFGAAYISSAWKDVFTFNTHIDIDLQAYRLDRRKSCGKGVTDE